MNIAQAKQIPLEAVLRHLQAQETSASPDRSEIWYKSPLREEKTASFKIDTRKNVWFDHGLGRGGTIIDFVMQHANLSVSEALKWLKTVPAQITLANVEKRATAQFQASSEPTSENFLLVKEKIIANKSLVEYLKYRLLPIELVNNYCKEIHFKSSKTGKPYYGIGFQNDREGWEVRGAIGDFKAVIGHKALTSIDPPAEAEEIDVFEGWSDFLTRIQMHGHAPTTAALILNSASLAGVGIEAIKDRQKYPQLKRIRLWFDNDDRGEAITNQFALELHELAEVGDMRETYAGFKDLNKWWTDCPTARRQEAAFRPYQDNKPDPESIRKPRQ